LKVRNYKVWRRGDLHWHDLAVEFNENVPFGSKVISGGHADRQTDRQTA